MHTYWLSITNMWIIQTGYVLNWQWLDYFKSEAITVHIIFILWYSKLESNIENLFLSLLPILLSDKHNAKQCGHNSTKNHCFCETNLWTPNLIKNINFQKPNVSMFSVKLSLLAKNYVCIEKNMAFGLIKLIKNDTFYVLSHRAYLPKITFLWWPKRRFTPWVPFDFFKNYIFFGFLLSH